MFAFFWSYSVCSSSRRLLKEVTGLTSVWNVRLLLHTSLLKLLINDVVFVVAVRDKLPLKPEYCLSNAPDEFPQPALGFLSALILKEDDKQKLDSSLSDCEFWLYNNVCCNSDCEVLNVEAADDKSGSKDAWKYT